MNCADAPTHALRCRSVTGLLLALVSHPDDTAPTTMAVEDLRAAAIRMGLLAAIANRSRVILDVSRTPGDQSSVDSIEARPTELVRVADGRERLVLVTAAMTELSIHLDRVCRVVRA